MNPINLNSGAHVGKSLFASAVTELRREELRPNESAFTGSFVLQFARVRMEQINSSLTRQLEQMKSCQAQTGALNDVLASIAQFSGGITKSEDREALKTAFTNAANKLPDPSQLRTKLLEMRDSNSAIANVAGDNVISEPEMSGLRSQVDGMLKKIDSAQQEEQLVVNLRLGQANEVMQLAASLIQGLHETAKGVIGRT